MTKDRITKADLEWWWEFAATREWTFAKTYALTPPHGSAPGLVDTRG